MTANALDDPAAFIAANLPLTATPSLPQIRLHQAGPSSGLWRLGEGDDAPSPYWAYVWAGGLVLARYLADHPQAVAGRRVLDLGAGSGLVAIAAMQAGAASAVAADIDPNAICATGLNAAASGVAITPLLGDLTAGPAPANIDTVLVGDLFYDPELAERVSAFLARCVAAGMAVLVGDPGRAFLPEARMTRLADYPVADFGAPTGGADSAVFAFNGPCLTSPLKQTPPQV